MDEITRFLDWLYDVCAVPDWAPREQVLEAYARYLEDADDLS